MLMRREMLAKYSTGSMMLRNRTNPCTKRARASDMCPVARTYLSLSDVNVLVLPTANRPLIDRGLTVKQE